MKRIPHARGVRQALRTVRTATQKSLTALNAAAGQLMGKGDYASAEMLAAKGKLIREFELEVEKLSTRWRELIGAGRTGRREGRSPLWAYYQPILRALADVGGESRRTGLEQHVQRLMAASLLPGDRETTPRGRERWRLMIQRARKPMLAEGWIEKGPAHAWRITDAGRLAARNAEASSLSRASTR